MNKEKITIKRANTDSLMISAGWLVYSMTTSEFLRFLDYTDELKQAAIWSKE
jgi:hypothetical protein